VLLLLHLGSVAAPDLDDRDTAGQLRQTLLELLPVEVRVGVLDLVLDLVDAALDRALVAVAVTIVVVSLATTTRRARPSWESWVFSS